MADVPVEESVSKFKKGVIKKFQLVLADSNSVDYSSVSPFEKLVIEQLKLFLATGNSIEYAEFARKIESSLSRVKLKNRLRFYIFSSNKPVYHIDILSNQKNELFFNLLNKYGWK